MDLPSSTSAAPQPPTHQSHGSGGQQQEGQPTVPIQSIHPHALQIGRVDAVGPPSQENPIPPPPNWLKNALDELQYHYPNDIFKGIMRYTAVSTTTDLPVSYWVRPNAPPADNVKYMYYPRIKCRDCQRKLYTPGPEMGVRNFEVHLKNRHHRERVERRVAAANGSGTYNISSVL